MISAANTADEQTMLLAMAEDMYAAGQITEDERDKFVATVYAGKITGDNWLSFVEDDNRSVTRMLEYIADRFEEPVPSEGVGVMYMVVVEHMGADAPPTLAEQITDSLAAGFKASSESVKDTTDTLAGTGTPDTELAKSAEKVRDALIGASVAAVVGVAAGAAIVPAMIVGSIFGVGAAEVKQRAREYGGTIMDMLRKK